MDHTFSVDERLIALPLLDPVAQAQVLSALTREARLVRLALSAARSDADRLAASLERVLGDVMDAESDSDVERAHMELVVVLALAHRIGLTVRATMEELSLDGVLGAQRLPVLTAVLANRGEACGSDASDCPSPDRAAGHHAQSGTGAP